MRKIVIGGCLLGALVMGGCDDGSSSGGNAAPGPSAAPSGAPSGTPSAAPSGSAKPEADKPKKAEGAKDHKARMKSLADAWAAHDAKKIAAHYAEDGVIKLPGSPDLKGRDAIEKRFTADFAAFKDFTIVPGRVWEKDKHTIVTEWVMKGTNSGDYPEAGIPKATNKPFGLSGAALLQINDEGFIKEEHIYFDALNLVAQVMDKKKEPIRGVMSAPPDGATHYESAMARESREVKDDKEKEKEKVEIGKEKELEKKNLEESDKIMGEINGGKLKDAMKRFAEDVVTADYTAEKDLKGKKAFEELLGGYFKAFPDMKAKNVSSFADAEFVIEEREYTGIQKGALGPIKPSNPPKSVDLHELEINEFKDGKVVKSWSWGNNAEMFAQLGVMPVEEKKEKKK